MTEHPLGFYFQFGMLMETEWVLLYLPPRLAAAVRSGSELEAHTPFTCHVQRTYSDTDYRPVFFFSSFFLF